MILSNSDYQEMVESRFGKPLKDIMHDLCVSKDVVPTKGASILDVPKSTFLAWRNKFRFGRNQRLVDRAEEFHSKQVEKLKKS